MNGKLKLVLKLPKSLQQDNNNSADAQLAKPSKKRKHPEGERSSKHASPASSQKAQKTGSQAHTSHAAGPGPSWPPVPDSNGARHRAEEAAKGQTTIKPRLHIK